MYLKMANELISIGPVFTDTHFKIYMGQWNAPIWVGKCSNGLLEGEIIVMTI